VLRLDGLAQYLVVGGERVAHRVAMLLPEAGRRGDLLLPGAVSL
jgi:hypothetical protein